MICGLLVCCLVIGCGLWFAVLWTLSWIIWCYLFTVWVMGLVLVGNSVA